MTSSAARGLAAVLADLLNWLRIYKQRAFWVQIGATVLAVLLWLPFIGSATAVFLFNLFVVVAFLCSVLTNIVWAGLKKSYSCVIGTIIGFGLFYVVWSGVVLQLRELAQILLGLLKGFLMGALFGYMAFLIFALSGLISVPRKRRLGSESSGESEARQVEAVKRDSSS